MILKCNLKYMQVSNENFYKPLETPIVSSTMVRLVLVLLLIGWKTGATLKTPNWFRSLRKFFISNAEGRKKCNASFNLFKAKLWSTFYFLKAIHKLLLLCWFLSNTFKTKKIQVKPEIHSYDFLQRHDSFEEAKNFSQFRELFMLDQLSEESL